MPVTFVPIASTTLASPQTGFTFSSIPQTYTDLLVRLSLRGTGSWGNAENILVTFNGVTSATYSYTFLRGNGSAADSGRASSTTSTLNGYANGGGTTSNTFASVEFYIPSYAATQAKPFSGFSAMENNSATVNWSNAVFASLWNQTAAITSMTLETSVQWASGSSFHLYGIKNS